MNYIFAILVLIVILVLSLIFAAGLFAIVSWTLHMFADEDYSIAMISINVSLLLALIFNFYLIFSFCSLLPKVLS